MAIDYIIEYDCIPKQTLTQEGIIQRLKEKERAETIIQWFRAAGDGRPPSEMGFEFSKSTPEEEGEKELIVVQDLLDHAANLEPLEHHCKGCPANRAGKPFGCMGFIQYPISARAEAWLLDRLPVPDEPLVWLLLKQGIEAFGYDGASVRALREVDQTDEDGKRTYFEIPISPYRRLGELHVSGDQMFEMIFGVGQHIIPNHAGILLLFFHVIDRELEADEIRFISSTDLDVRNRHDFKLTVAPNDDERVHEFSAFFHAMFIAWKLNVPLFVDA